MLKQKLTAELLKRELRERLQKMYATTPSSATVEQLYKALATILRELLEEKLRYHDAKTFGEGAKQVCYLSMEFLVGRSLKNNLYNLGLETEAAEALAESGVTLEQLYEVEPDAGLGNGGLGRLAACYMDGLATESYTATGYSILYEYGIFRQKITDGWQQELPDNWLPGGDVWLERKADEGVTVKFDGEIRESWYNNFHHVEHVNYNSVRAVPYDMYISGYDTGAVSRLRLFKAEAPGIDMDSFNRGDYTAALRNNSTAELISKVLYPNDNHIEGKILRLRQQYFLCCAAVNDIVQKHLAQYGTLDNLPEKVAVQLNDTHPTLAIPELMRILLDECGFSWERAFDIVRHVFSYTNHTVLSEALETWDADMFKSVLPRIFEIVAELDKTLRSTLEQKFPGDIGKISYMSILRGGYVCMANLCVYVCHRVNGVSALHSEIIKEEVFHDYWLFAPDKFCNVTNGIAYRRWLLQSNPGLVELLDGTIGERYKKDAAALSDFAAYADQKDIQQRLAQVKLDNKRRLAAYIEKAQGVEIDPETLFDVQAKRMHEYKRQHLNALHIVRQYLELKDDPNADFVPRTYIFGAKAAPGYYIAKQMIRLICGLSKLLEQDEAVRGKLRIVYLEDYRVTLSELLMPAAEISEQISLAGTEASGTGNMKLMLGGAPTLGTYDGANIEILEHAGKENFFLFGMDKQQVLQCRADGYSPQKLYESDPALRRALDFVGKGFLDYSFTDLYNNLTQQDPYLVLADFESYCEAQRRVDAAYRDAAAWNRMSAMNIAGAGFFSADRAVTQYAKDIWHIRPVK
ncbi:MAG: glycogen/starch/alpha-glucan phosphorylase [Oscillospiraceae bacterium]|nr:glycogen/starch/alpha-glucan phosphorylase [Oscillospiraceae bacterium]